ncbi:MAG TPA: hypothetical protein QF621_07320 [Candidatus Thalassarchaeaceae archaeon]|nr:hypothetical protein [Candidatus Thalassarchaeaceae archaeon]HJL60146.1 hypothetical protein [Candidatus Thalassarchaeaceae archaeon]HJM87548.1 hypothetical protein [Candidatus Thalassarchaeaceae archaeon]
MVYCPSCSEQQDDNTKFCRFCGDSLPGPEIMIKLRQEALALASQRAGHNLSASQTENDNTIQLVKRNASINTHKNVNNGEHKQSTHQVTNNLKNLMQDF